MGFSPEIHRGRDLFLLLQMLITLKWNIVDPMFLLPKCVLELYILCKTIKNFGGRGLEVKILRPEISNEMYSWETHFGNKNIRSTMFRFKVISIYNNKNRSRPRCIFWVATFPLQFDYILHLSLVRNCVVNLEKFPV